MAIPDVTRTMDPVPVLETLQERLPNDFRVTIGLGLHRRMTKVEIGEISRWNPIQHDPDDCVTTALIQGIPGGVHRSIADADFSISVGVAELHQYAGLSGGHKGVAVGCGSRETIASLHHRDRVTAPGVLIGQLDGNPFRSAIDDLGQAARCNHALLHVPSAGVWIFGDPISALHEAAARMDPWTYIDEQVDVALLKVPPSKGKSLYQASRAATYLALSPSPPVREGGRLIIDASLEEGLGFESGFCSALAAVAPPWTSLLRGEPPTGPGAQRAVMFALMAKKWQLEIQGCVDPAPFLAVGIPARRDRPASEEGTLLVNDPFNSIPQWRST